MTHDGPGMPLYRSMVFTMSPRQCCDTVGSRTRRSASVTAGQVLEFSQTVDAALFLVVGGSASTQAPWHRRVIEQMLLKHRPQPGRRRAILGLTFSYVLIVLAVVTLLVWLLLGAGRQTDAASTTDTMTPSATPSVRSTVITPPAQGRLRVSVADLRVGDCVEIQKNEPVPTRRADKVYIYRTHCVVGDGIFMVRQIVSDGQHCPSGEYLANEQETICACFVKYSQ